MAHNVLVLGGGGAKGVAYSGAIEPLNLKQFDLVVGTSAGAFTGFLIALGVPKDKIKEMCELGLEEILSEDCLEKYGNKSSLEALTIMKEDKEKKYNNKSDKLRTIGLNHIVERMKQISYALHLLKEEKTFMLPSDYGITFKEQKISENDKEEFQSIYDEVNRISNTPKDFTFAHFSWIREGLKHLGVDAQLKRLIVTTVWCNSAERLDHTMQPVIMGDGEYMKMDYIQKDDQKEIKYDINVIDAVLASGAFPGVFPPVIIEKGYDIYDIFADGGIMMNEPTFLGIKHRSNKEESQVVSLMLNELSEDVMKRENEILGFGGIVLVEFAREPFEVQLNCSLQTEDLKNCDKESNEIVFEFAKKNKNKLFEINVKPKDIDTLSANIKEKTKKAAIKSAKEIVIQSLEQSGLLCPHFSQINLRT